VSQLEIDPIIKALADRELIAKRARSLFRHHRPVIEVLQGHASPYSIDMAVYDAMTKRSLIPEASGGLLKEVVTIARVGLPNHDTIQHDRQAKAHLYNSQTVDQQG
jgi:hypothetical protein